jgi:cytochrome c553
MHLARIALLAAPFVFALACGGSTPAPVAPAPSSTAPTDSSAPAPSAVPAASAASDGTLAPFETLTSMEDKAARMKTVVKPQMAKVFQAHDASHYGDFSCATCHGPKMSPKPKDFLPKLDLTPDGFKKMMADKPDMVKFMHEQVVPAMATAMGDKPYDPATKQGFGCTGCHASK